MGHDLCGLRNSGLTMKELSSAGKKVKTSNSLSPHWLVSVVPTKNAIGGVGLSSSIS